jgi:hypothetical protein
MKLVGQILMGAVITIGATTLYASPIHQSGGDEETSSRSTVDDTIRFPETVNAGSTLIITGHFAAKDLNPVIKIRTVGGDLTKDAGTDPDTTKKVSDTEIDVKLPDKLPSGRYYLTLDYGDVKGKIIPSELRVSGSAVTLDSAHPATAYRSANGGFDFDVVGQGFSNKREDNNIYIKGQGLIVKSWADNQKTCEESSKEKKPCLWYDPQQPDKLHIVGYPGEAYQGPLSFRVQVGSVQSGVDRPLVLARLSPSGIRFWSILIFGVLAYVVYGLVAAGLRNGVDNVIDGQRYSPFTSFFLDKQTDTYSLSKFQLLLFSATFIFGYLYVFLCSWLVQWHFVLPDVPAAFSGILGMSAGTTVVAAGATSARGSKGAGGTRPSFSDFITTGGQVVPERFQYFVWTLVACFGFAALLLSQDPATITGFPDIPQGLLYVMGVSAGGYLAGKVTRAPGPVIRNITWNKDQKQLFVQGENLSNDGDYFIDGKKLPIITQGTDAKSLVNSTPQEQASDRTFCSELKVTVDPKAGFDLDTGDHVFRIMNKDAQFSDARFTADPPQIKSVTMLNPPPSPISVPTGADPSKVIGATKGSTVIKVSGSGFRAGTIARWTQPGAKESLEITSVQVQDSSNLSLTLQPGDPGPATLLLITSNGFSAVATVALVSPGSGARRETVDKDKTEEKPMVNEAAAEKNAPDETVANTTAPSPSDDKERAQRGRSESERPEK